MTGEGQDCSKANSPERPLFFPDQFEKKKGLGANPKMPRNPLEGSTRSADVPTALGPWIAVADQADPENLDTERRLEDWLVCHLEDRDSATDAPDLLENLLTVGLRHRSSGHEANRASAQASASGSGSDWSRLRMVRVRGISLVRFPDSRLLREDALRTVADELLALARAGHHRLVLDFEGVTRMSSQILGALAELQRRCESSEGGQLRVSGLRPELAELFQITGLARSIPLFDEAKGALEAPWPQIRGPRPLPISVLTALGGSESEEGPISDPPSEVVEANRTMDPEPPQLRLVALAPKAGTGAIAVEANPFVIGRDRSSQLHAQFPAISRSHASIEWEGGSWVVRDLNSTNGTYLNGQEFRGLARPLTNGDEIRVGPLRFTVLLGDGPAPEEAADDLVASWLREDAEPDETERETRLELPVDDEPVESLKVAVIEGVLVLTPRLTDLEADQALETLRASLAAALAGPNSRQVVIDLQYVGTISSRTIGLLMATFLRLDRRGGRLRICQPSAPVRALLDRIRMPMLVPVFASLEEAVLNVWS